MCSDYESKINKLSKNSQRVPYSTCIVSTYPNLTSPFDEKAFGELSGHRWQLSAEVYRQLFRLIRLEPCNGSQQIKIRAGNL